MKKYLYLMNENNFHLNEGEEINEGRELNVSDIITRIKQLYNMKNTYNVARENNEIIKIVRNKFPNVTADTIIQLCKNNQSIDSIKCINNNQENIKENIGENIGEKLQSVIDKYIGILNNLENTEFEKTKNELEKTKNELDEKKKELTDMILQVENFKEKIKNAKEENKKILTEIENAKTELQNGLEEIKNQKNNLNEAKINMVDLKKNLYEYKIAIVNKTFDIAIDNIRNIALTKNSDAKFAKLADELNRLRENHISKNGGGYNEENDDVFLDKILNDFKMLLKK